jgi:hypothetical protein
MAADMRRGARRAPLLTARMSSERYADGVAAGGLVGDVVDV